MEQATVVSSQPAVRSRPAAGATIPFDTISTPGTYVCNWSGHLMRIPERTIVPGEALRLNIIGREPLTVTKLSDNPSVPLTEARRLAQKYGVTTGF